MEPDLGAMDVPEEAWDPAEKGVKPVVAEVSADGAEESRDACVDHGWLRPVIPSMIGFTAMTKRVSKPVKPSWKSKSSGLKTD